MLTSSAMKEIDNIKYFNVADICENVFHNKITQEEIIGYFEAGKIIGKKIDNEWHANDEAINNFYHNVFLEERAFTVGPHRIDLSDIKLKGRILDIGGGGEGVIGQFKREQVVAIDPNRKELEEAPSIGDLKIVMDAKDLKFLDNTFDTATSFFTFMYVPKTDHNKIFQEIYRVLKKNGEFAIWDIILPRREDNKKELFVIRLKIKIGDKTIDTGYGTMWNKEQDMHYFSNLGKDIGFKILESREDDNNFYLRFRKE